jgi:hypothetical protein
MMRCGWPNCLAHGLIRASFVPDTQTQEMRNLLRNVGRVNIGGIDFLTGHETVDIDRPGAFNLDSIQLFVFRGDKIVLADRIPFDLVLGIDDVLSLLIDELALYPVARFPIDGVKPNPCRFDCRGVEGEARGAMGNSICSAAEYCNSDPSK